MASFLKLIYSQCDGCNDQFQSIDLWNLKYNCSKFLENYNDCNSLKFTELFTDNLLLNNFEFGSQNWIDGKLDYFYLFDNRYKINDSTLLDLANVKYLFLDGVSIELDTNNREFYFNSEYLLFRQNGISTLLNNFRFSKNLKYISLDENNFHGELPDYLFSYSNLKNLSIEFNDLSGSISNNVSSLKKIINLTINNNQLSGNVPESICELENLKKLHLQYNNLSVLPECICELHRRGVEIELYGNKFCEEIPKCAEDIIGFQDCF